jgi:hypothetical protein
MIVSGRPAAKGKVPRLAGSGLVQLPARTELVQAWKINRSTDRGFALDLIVRTPKNMEWRLREGDWFLREIVSRGKVLYEKAHTRVAVQG